MKKTVQVEGHKSDWYEKAIFILKDSKNAQVPQNLVTHADDILEKKLKTGEYMQGANNLNQYTMFNKVKSKPRQETSWNWIDDFFGISLSVLGVAIIFYLLF